MTRTNDYLQRDKKHIWHPFTQMREWMVENQIVIEKGEGCFLIDTDGKRYIDGVSSLWCNVHGHRKRELDEALKTQADKIAHSTFLGLSNVPAIELAERLIKIVPSGLTRVFYSDSGAAAVEVALKMGYQYWQQKNGGNPHRKKYLHLTNSYHGDTLGSVSVGGMPLFHRIYKPFIFETYASPAPYCYRCPLECSPATCGMKCAEVFERMVADHHGELIGVIMEPLMLGAAGMLKQPAGFLARVRAVTKKYGLLLICDEVATGFGRTGALFACNTERVVPDLMTVGKGITGGYLPLSATLATEEVFSAFLGEYDEFKTFFHGHTYSGNPLAAAVAVANLDVFEKERTIDQLQPKIALIEKWAHMLMQHPHVGDVRQAGFMIGIELVKDTRTREPYPAMERRGHRTILKARERGVIIRPLGDVVVLMPPLGIEMAVLQELLDVTAWAIDAACA